MNEGTEPKRIQVADVDLGDVAYLGHRQHWDGERLFGLSAIDRRQHTLLIGKTGTGKTTLLRNMLIQQIHAGDGVGLLDPHGDIAQDLLEHIPSGRVKDVIYFNPADLEHPFSFNLLKQVAPSRRHLTVSGIISALRSIWRSSWGPRMEYILSCTLSALLECQNTSLLGVQRMLSEEDYRAWVLKQVTDPVIRGFWLNEFGNYDPRFRREAIAPIQNKVGQLLMAGPIRNVLGQVRNRLDLRWAMDHKRIFIANLSKGHLGEDGSNLLGALLISGFEHAAMSRADISEKERVDFTLYVDEFQNFATDSFATILAESRKQRLGLVLAHQYLDQLSEELAAAVLGNVGTFISFRVSEKDGAALSREFGGHFDPSLFSGLDNHHVCVKLLVNGRYGDAFLGKTLPSLAVRYDRGEGIIRWSRQRYAAHRADVEGRISRWMNRQESGRKPKKSRRNSLLS